MTAPADIRARAARFYVERLHWRVLPLYEMRADGRCACGGDCGKNAGKHPRTAHGVDDARAYVGQVCTWWQRWPQANVGIATGEVSGIVVLDVDPRHGGDDSLSDLQQDHGELPETAIVHTGGGGQHFYFQHPGAGHEVSNRKDLGGYRGLDLKGDGGYIVGAPSNHQSGGTYLWDAMFHITETPLALCPDFLLELARQGPSNDRAKYDTAAWNGALPACAARVIASSELVRRRYLRSATGLTDTSPSGVDYSLACQLACMGFEGREIEHTIRASRKRAGLPWKRQSYFDATVGKALATAKRRVSNAA